MTLISAPISKGEGQVPVVNALAGPRPSMRRKRLGLGLTLNGLAARCTEAGAPVTAPALSRIERRLQAPRPALRKTLADVLGMSTDDFPIAGNLEDEAPAKNPPVKKPVVKRPGPERRVPGARERAARVTAGDHVNRLGLGPGTEKALISAGVKFVGDVAGLAERSDLVMVPDIGMFQRAVIERVLCEMGLYPAKPCLTGEPHPVTGTCLIGCLGVSTRTSGALVRADAGSVAETAELITTGEISSVRGIGPKGCEELRIALANADLQGH